MTVERTPGASPGNRRGRDRRPNPVLIHLTTTDMSLDWLLGPQLVAFRDAGYEVIGASAAGPHVAALEAAGIEHIALANATRAMDVRRDLAAFREFAAVLRRVQPDIVHTHNPKPGFYGRLAARLVRVPAVVNTVHGLFAVDDDAWLKRRTVYTLERVASVCSDAELVQNPEDLDTLARLGVPRSKLHLLGNGIDLVRFDPARFADDERAQRRAELGVGDDAVVVGLVGRLVREKGYREVFDAARLVRAHHPEVHVVVIGPSDPDKADAIDAAEIAAAADPVYGAGVTFLGSRNDVDAWYTAMDLYVLASYREGFPRSAMEAAAMGLPIVATDIRGCRQVVEDGVTGYLVPPREVIGLAEAIDALVRHVERREAMGRAAKARARRLFDQQHVIDITLSTYERLLGTRAPGVRRPS